jgi:vancomycin permeability regulator SanA
MKRPPKIISALKRVFIIPLAALAGFLLISAGVIVASGLTDHIHPADVAVVFGNKVELNGQPSVRLRARLDKAASLYKQDYFPIIFVSGGIGVEGYDEADVMKKYLIGQGIPESAIVTDNQGIDTFATARNATGWMEEKGYQSVMVISQYFHIPRARLAFEKCGVAPVYSAHADLFEWRDLYHSIPREVVGWFVYSAQGCK